ncbi:MAG: ComF family protein [Candidatus Moranbacteria bacterium]|nr:ComF family protein [Candidatus Moranbacteria bacterium]
MLKLTKFLNILEKATLDIVLPKHCLHCHKEETFLCPECLDLIKINSFQVCPLCQKSLTEYGEICRYCRSFKPPIDGLITAANYDNPLVARLIRLFKYKFIDQLSDPLSKILIKAYQKNKLAIPDLIIPVPLHPLRLRWRGFNQAELLAQNLAQNLLPGFPIKVNSEILTRVKYTLAQANLKKSEDRQQNVQDAFQIDLKALDKIKNRRILLIDDICTTGSTLMECGKQLRKLKPKTIQGVVVARQG